jgi:hypothetical protein
MTMAVRTPIAAIACALALLAALLAGPLAQRADAQIGPSPFATPANNPLRGDGMWIWYVSKAQGGKPGKIARRAKRRGIETVLIKSGDAGKYWSQFSSGLVSALHARGLKVCAWQFVYGNSPTAEANVAAQAIGKGADCFVIDAEGHYEGKYASASTYMTRLRSLVGPDYPIGLAAFPYVDYHPAFPYSVFLGPGGAQYNMPQLYWKTIGTKVDTAFVHTYVFNRAYGRPILPLGQVYLNPKKKQIKRFRRLAASHHMDGVSWWSWQHAGKRQWKAVGGGTAPISGFATYDSYPYLRLGSKGDLVAWAQQLLAGGGFYTPITGYFESPTRDAVLSMQAAKGLPLTGAIDVPTWNVLLTFQPQAVRWTSGGAVAASGAPGMPEPRSAKLPAKGYEIPPGPNR